MAETEIMERGPEAGEATTDRPFGPVAAAFLAAGIGSVMLGLLTVLAEASTSIHDALEFSKSVGPLSGKTLIAAGTFFATWGILHAVMRDKDPAPKKVFVWTGILVLVGVAMTFPPIFQSFTAE